MKRIALVVVAFAFAGMVAVGCGKPAANTAKPGAGADNTAKPAAGENTPAANE